MNIFKHIRSWTNNLFVPNKVRYRVIRRGYSFNMGPPIEKQVLLREEYFWGKWRTVLRVAEEDIPLYVLAQCACGKPEFKSAFSPFDENGILPIDHPIYPAKK